MTMKGDSNSEKMGCTDYSVILGILVVIVIVILGVVACTWHVVQDAITKDTCIRAGYADMIQWSEKDFCIGYNLDGGKVRLIEVDMLTP